MNCPLLIAPAFIQQGPPSEQLAGAGMKRDRPALSGTVDTAQVSRTALNTSHASHLMLNKLYELSIVILFFQMMKLKLRGIK